MPEGCRGGWRLCLPTGTWANSVGSKTLTASSCTPSALWFRASVMSKWNLSYLQTHSTRADLCHSMRVHGGHDRSHPFQELHCLSCTIQVNLLLQLQNRPNVGSCQKSHACQGCWQSEGTYPPWCKPMRWPLTNTSASQSTAPKFSKMRLAEAPCMPAATFQFWGTVKLRRYHMREVPTSERPTPAHID